MPTRKIALAQLEACDLSDSEIALDEALGAVERAGSAEADLCILPEGTYPGYVLGSLEAGRERLAVGPDPIESFANAARDSDIEVIVGLVLPQGDGLLNAAVHFGSDGTVRNQVAKRFLWHFDEAWFQPGQASAVVDGVGMLVCADGRLPEIASGLVQQGAGLLVNSTAWVVSRPAPTGTNAQAEFLWRVRALESGVAAAACTKVGTESGVAMYAGRSQLVAADGSPVVVASATEAELVVADVDVPAHPSPPAIRSVEVLSPVAVRSEPGYAYLVVLSDSSLLESVASHGCRLIVAETGVVHVDRLAVTTLHDDDLLVAGPARAAAFGGAEIVVWMAHSVSTIYVEEVARTRALENRVFVVVWRPVCDGGPFVVDPSGAILASAPPDIDHAVGVSILPTEAASKEVAPGSDLFAGAARIISENG